MSKVVLEQSKGPATSSEVNKETKVQDNYKEGSKVEKEEVDNKLRSEGSDKEAANEKKKHVSGSGKEVDEGLEDVKNAFDGRDGFTIVHNLAQFETPSTYLNCGLDRCCELDTKNEYFMYENTPGPETLEETKAKDILMVAREKSDIYFKNPCFCFNCLLCGLIYCCHCDCSRLRAFTMLVFAKEDDGVNLGTGVGENDYAGRKPIILIKRKCRADCCCCCPDTLQSVQVTDGSGNLLGSIEQLCQASDGWIPNSRTFEAKDEANNVIYTIQTPYTITVYPCIGNEVAFSMHDGDGTEVGAITRTVANLQKDEFSDTDQLRIDYPENCDFKMKAVLLAATILFDYVLYTN